MARFRRRTPHVEAVQWFPGTHVDGVQELVHDPGDGSTASNGCGIVETFNGPARVHPGDWVITEEDGFHYRPCRPNRFVKEWEPIE